MKFINGWKYLWKDSDRVEVKLRGGLLTVVDVYIDFSDRRWRLVVLNFGVGN
jgi:hypothetical protein